ncbi:MAG: hypothetical protein ACO3RV_05685, partial [Luteolibacter sp.]
SNNAGSSWGDVLLSSKSSPEFGGGNTLRIGRPEHPRFDQPGQRAAHLLDLFHTGRSRSENSDERQGPLTEIAGHINLNTASREALGMALAGKLEQDPEMSRFIADRHDTAAGRRYPLVQKLTGAALPDITETSKRMADAIIESRPFASTAELAASQEKDGTPIFGNPTLFNGFTNPTRYPRLQWTDSAAEESFARLFDAASVRSRNFRVWVIGQSVEPTTATNADPKVLAEVRKCFSVFADPGERESTGEIKTENFQLRILHENDF